MEKKFITVQDAADLLSVTERAIQLQIQRKQLDAWTMRGRSRGGNQYLIALDSLPEEAQERYWNGQFVDPLQLFTEDMMQKYTIEQRNLALFRYTVVRAYCSSGMSMRAFVKEKANAFEKPFSYKQLRAWREKFFDQGIEGLMEQRSRANTGKNCIPPEAWNMFYSLYMQTQKRSARLCYDKTKLQFPDMTASYQTFTRRLREVPEYAKLQYREGMKAFNDKLPYMDRDKSGMHSNQTWVSDHHRADVFVRGKDGKVFRPWITVFTDAKSTKVMAFVVREAAPMQQLSNRRLESELQITEFRKKSTRITAKTTFPKS